MTARNLLDQVHSLARIEAFEPERHAAALAAELPPATTPAEIATRDALLAAALAEIDAMTARVMRIRLDHALASDSSIGPPTRSVFASTIVGYAADLPLLAQRAHDVALRGGAGEPDRVAERVVEAARATLELRDATRAGVLALSRETRLAAEELERKAAEPKPEPTLADLLELD